MNRLKKDEPRVLHRDRLIPVQFRERRNAFLLQQITNSKADQHGWRAASLLIDDRVYGLQIQMIVVVVTD